MKQFEKTWRPLARSCEQSARLAKVYEKNLSAPEVTATQIQSASEPGQNETQEVTDAQKALGRNGHVLLFEVLKRWSAVAIQTATEKLTS